ncbi:hypothetical protein HTZ77_32160 [Nonomuraea sp. SMC257]|uniref:Uncharacterized protein n=1 Tax=Nonomuraea montanisoli TaxID=2741721 RepID=A0A7Y6IFU9_9ACTN|nr:hypothetical protein [Nonomuraea montanisoli]NUW36039.1 hypothetical protein [Nonomuraea montanisoli]
MNRDSDIGGRLEPVPAKVKPAGERMNRIPLLLILGAVPLLLANWFIATVILGHDCTLLYEGGNITECAGGLSEEEMTATSGLMALVLLVVQIGLIVLLCRRTRGS